MHNNILHYGTVGEILSTVEHKIECHQTSFNISLYIIDMKRYCADYTIIQ